MEEKYYYRVVIIDDSHFLSRSRTVDDPPFSNHIGCAIVQVGTESITNIYDFLAETVSDRVTNVNKMTIKLHKCSNRGISIYNVEPWNIIKPGNDDNYHWIESEQVKDEKALCVALNEEIEQVRRSSSSIKFKIKCQYAVCYRIKQDDLKNGLVGWSVNKDKSQKNHFFLCPTTLNDGQVSFDVEKATVGSVFYVHVEELANTNWEFVSCRMKMRINNQPNEMFPDCKFDPFGETVVKLMLLDDSLGYYSYLEQFISRHGLTFDNIFLLDGNLLDHILSMLNKHGHVDLCKQILEKKGFDVVKVVLNYCYPVIVFIEYYDNDIQNGMLRHEEFKQTMFYKILKDIRLSVAHATLNMSTGQLISLAGNLLLLYRTFGIDLATKKRFPQVVNDDGQFTYPCKSGVTNCCTMEDVMSEIDSWHLFRTYHMMLGNIICLLNPKVSPTVSCYNYKMCEEFDWKSVLNIIDEPPQFVRNKNLKGTDDFGKKVLELFNTFGVNQQKQLSKEFDLSCVFSTLSTCENLNFDWSKSAECCTRKFIMRLVENHNIHTERSLLGTYVSCQDLKTASVHDNYFISELQNKLRIGEDSGMKFDGPFSILAVTFKNKIPQKKIPNSITDSENMKYERIELQSTNNPNLVPYVTSSFCADKSNFEAALIQRQLQQYLDITNVQHIVQVLLENNTSFIPPETYFSRYRKANLSKQLGTKQGRPKWTYVIPLPDVHTSYDEFTTGFWKHFISLERVNSLLEIKMEDIPSFGVQDVIFVEPIKDELRKPLLDHFEHAKYVDIRRVFVKNRPSIHNFKAPTRITFQLSDQINLTYKKMDEYSFFKYVQSFIPGSQFHQNDDQSLSADECKNYQRCWGYNATTNQRCKITRKIKGNVGFCTSHSKQLEEFQSYILDSTNKPFVGFWEIWKNHLPSNEIFKMEEVKDNKCKGFTDKNKRCNNRGQPDYCHLHVLQQTVSQSGPSGISVHDVTNNPSNQNVDNERTGQSVQQETTVSQSGPSGSSVHNDANNPLNQNVDNQIKQFTRLECAVQRQVFHYSAPILMFCELCDILTKEYFLGYFKNFQETLFYKTIRTTRVHICHAATFRKTQNWKMVENNLYNIYKFFGYDLSQRGKFPYSEDMRLGMVHYSDTTFFEIDGPLLNKDIKTVMKTLEDPFKSLFEHHLSSLLPKDLEKHSKNQANYDWRKEFLREAKLPITFRELQTFDILTEEDLKNKVEQQLWPDKDRKSWMSDLAVIVLLNVTTSTSMSQDLSTFCKIFLNENTF